MKDEIINEIYKEGGKFGFKTHRKNVYGTEDRVAWTAPIFNTMKEAEYASHKFSAMLGSGIYGTPKSAEVEGLRESASNALADLKSGRVGYAAITLHEALK